jgi:hypothetical protein
MWLLIAAEARKALGKSLAPWRIVANHTVNRSGRSLRPRTESGLKSSENNSFSALIRTLPKPSFSHCA